jgi:hypothetical protein
MPTGDHEWAELWTLEKRKAMRQSLQEGERLTRPATRKSQSSSGENPDKDTEWTNKLDRLIRFNVFLTHSNLNANELIDHITDSSLPHETPQFAKLRTKLMENTRSHKNKTIDNLEDHIAILLKDNGWLKDMGDEGFKRYLHSHLNQQNWQHIWVYMKDYVDYENSSELGKWFMKNIYANLGHMACKLVIAGGRKERTADALKAREDILKAWDALALRQEFDEIDIYEFAELSNRVRADREKRKRDFTEVNAQFTTVGGPAPPKRGRPRQPPARRPEGDIFGGDGTWEYEYQPRTPILTNSISISHLHRPRTCATMMGIPTMTISSWSLGA